MPGQQQQEKSHEHKRRTPSDDMRPEYTFDYTTAVRGKYYRQLLKEGANVAVLEPDVAEASKRL